MTGEDFFLEWTDTVLSTKVVACLTSDNKGNDPDEDDEDDEDDDDDDDKHCWFIC